MSARVRRGLIIACATYAALWLLTATLGSRGLEERLQAQSERRWGTQLRRAPSRDAGTNAYPYFTAKSFTPAPFVVRVDIASGVMPLSEEGDRRWFIWVFGWARQIRWTPRFVT